MKTLGDHLHDLIDNGLEAGADKIMARMEITGEGILKVSIRDNGKGIPETVLNQVTDPFFTTRTTRRMGLGLALIHQNSLDFGGEMSLSSVEGEGTELSFSWDLCHIDCLPCGNLPEICTLLMAINDDVLFDFRLETTDSSDIFSSTEIKAAIHPFSLREPEVAPAVQEYATSVFYAFISKYISYSFQHKSEHKKQKNDQG